MLCCALKIPPGTQASTSGSTAIPTVTGLEQSKPSDYSLRSRNAYLQTNEPPSIIAVQGLGAHKYYTWVRKERSAIQQENPKPLSRFGFIPRRRKIAQTPEPADAAQFSDAATKETNNAPPEVMWLTNVSES